jgi:hypothetical protein
MSDLWKLARCLTVRSTACFGGAFRGAAVCWMFKASIGPAFAQAPANEIVLGRLVERISAMVAAFVLIFIGYLLSRNKVEVQRNSSTAQFKIGSVSEFNLKGYGTGVICLVLGVVIIVASIFNTIVVDPVHNKYIFFNKPSLQEISESREIEFLKSVRLLARECSVRVSDAVFESACAGILSVRDDLLNSKYSNQRTRYLHLKAINDQGALPPIDLIEYMTLAQIFG